MKKTDPKTKRVYIKPRPGETAKELAKRMTRIAIDAINEDRAANGLPPLPKKSPRTN
jgi:hypothetical protein